MIRSISFIFVIFLAAACGAAPQESVSISSDTSISPSQEILVVTQEVAAEDNAPVADNSAGEPLPPVVENDTAQQVSYTAPAWANLELVNAITGETFTLADFAGKTVFIEPMATWCTNCRAQQGRVAEVMASLGTENFVFISMSVESGLSNETLADYAARNSFPQLFVVGTNELLEALVNQYGRSILNPPATPHFIISPNGTVSSLSTGAHSVDELTNQMLAAQNS